MALVGQKPSWSRAHVVVAAASAAALRVRPAGRGTRCALAVPPQARIRTPVAPMVGRPLNGQAPTAFISVFGGGFPPVNWGSIIRLLYT